MFRKFRSMLSGASKTPQKRSRLRLEQLERREVPATFSAGNLVLLRVGDGATALSNAAAAGAIVELTTAGLDPAGGANVVALPGFSSGGNNQGGITFSGSASSGTGLNLSQDGQYLSTIGYDSQLGIASVSGTSSATANRTIARIDASGNAVIVARLTDSSFSGDNARAVVSTDGTAFYATGTSSSSGATGGVRYVTYDGVTPASSSTSITTGNFRQVGIVGGNLVYDVQASMSRYVGLPTATATATSLGVAIVDAGQFVFLDRQANVGDANLGGAVDTLYVANNSAANSIAKYFWDGTAWVAAGIAAPVPNITFYGLTGHVSGSDAALYATTNVSGTSSLRGFTDTAAYDAMIAGSFTTLATAGANYWFRGIAFAPQAAVPVSTTTAVTSVNPATAEFGTTITLQANVVADSGTNTPTGTVSFMNGNTVLATANVTGSGATGTATATSTTIPVGNYTNITAVYTPTGLFTGSTSPVFNGSLTISGTTTTTSVTSIDPTTAAFGSTVTFHADVVAASGANTPTGTVSFMDGAILLATGNVTGSGLTGTVTATSTAVPVGSYTNIIAIYTATGSFAGSTSGVFNGALTIQPPLASYTGGVYSQDFNALPSTGTFTFAGNGPFFLKTPPVAGANLDGWQIQNTGTGTNALFGVDNGSSSTLAAYSYGAANSSDRALGSFANNTTAMRYGATYRNDSTTTYSSVALSFAVEMWRRGATALDTQIFEYAFGFDATDIKTGNFIPEPAGDVVSILPQTAGPVDGNSATAIKTLTLSGSWAPGDYLSIRWTDSNSAGGADDGVAIDNLTLVGDPATTTATVTSVTPSSAGFGSSVTLQAAIVADTGVDTPTGTVQFMDGSTVLATANVTGSGVNGTATAVTTAIPIGNYTNIVAVYTPLNIAFTTSASPAFNGSLTITGTSTVTSLTSISPTTAGYGDPITFEATVVAQAGAATPTGTVQFMDGATILATGNVAGSGVNGTVSIVSTAVPVGVYSNIVAVYVPTGAFGTSSSAAFSGTVTVGNPLIAYTGGIYSQNFDSLPSAGTYFFNGVGPFFLKTPPVGGGNLAGWQIQNTGSGANAIFGVDNGSSATPSAYSYGATGSSDRALGSFASGTTAMRLGATFRNDSNAAISSIALGFSVEMWRRGAATLDTLAFEYSVGATSTDIQAASFTPNSGGDVVSILPQTAGALDGNTATALKSFTIDNAGWLPGEYLTIRWTDTNSTGGADDGLAIDNLFLVGNPVGTSAVVTSVSPTAADFGESVTFQATVTAATGTATPTGIVQFIDGSTVLATGTVTGNGPTGTVTASSTTIPLGTYSSIVAVYTPTIAFGSSTSAPFAGTLTVTGTIPPAITSANHLTIVTGSSDSFQVTATGFPTNFTYDLIGEPNWVSIDASGLITFAANRPAIAGSTPYAFTIVVGNTTAPDAMQTFTVTDTLPLIGFTQWTFPTLAAPPFNSPEPSVGTGTAIVLGMDNAYNGGNTANADIIVSTGVTVPTYTVNTWRIRGAGNNGWATHAAGAAQYTQGAELDVSTIGYGNIKFSFDWQSTAQGIRDLQFQYTLDKNNPNGWTNYGGTSPAGTYIAAPNDFYNGAGSSPNITIDLSSIDGVSDNPNFGVRLVSAYDSTGNIANDYAGATLLAGATELYNNSSGNWRFGNFVFAGNETIGTTTALVGAPNPSAGLQSVTFTATVSAAAGSPTGTVNFFDGVTLFGSSPVINGTGVATFDYAALPAGSHDITATFVGSGLFENSTSSVAQQVVNANVTATALTDNGPSPSTPGQQVSFTVVVTGGASLSGQTVSLKDASNSNVEVGLGTLDNAGQATINVSSLSAGSHNLFAVYAGNSFNAGSQSPQVTHVVSAANPPAVVGIAVNGNLPDFAGPQRSRVVSLQVAFNQPVQIDNGAFALALHANNLGLGELPTALNSASTDGGTTWVITFNGNTDPSAAPPADGFQSIKDGVYDLNVNAALVHPVGVPGVSGVGITTSTFYRLFGDATGEELPQVGNDHTAIVAIDDNFSFRSSFNNAATYEAYFDYDGDGVIGIADNFQFRSRFNRQLTWTA